MKKLSIGIGFISAALLCSQAWAGETEYAAGNWALPLQQAGGTARAAAMGAAVVALSQGSASLLWNPAGLSRMNCSEVGLHHNTGLGDTIQEIGIIGFPLGEVTPSGKCREGKVCEDGKGGSLGGIAASLGYVTYGKFDGRSITGLPTNNYQAKEYSGSLGWGHRFGERFSGGIAVKANKSDLADKNYDAFAADLGLLWTVVPALDLGLTHSNINLGKKLGGSEPVSGWRMGAAWTVDNHLLLTASTELQYKAVNRLQLGTEYLIGYTANKVNVLALRAGYQVNYPNPLLTGLTGLTFGLGYKITRSMALDYAMVPSGELGASHRLSMTFKFNCPVKKHPPVVVAVAVIMPPEPSVVTHAPVSIVAPAEPAPKVIKMALLEDSHFDFDKSTLRPEGMAALRENVQILRDNPKAMVRVAGYTSMMGTEEYNQKLSERRAIAVAMFLIQEGIESDRIVAIGYGETRPKTYEDAPDDYNSDAAQSNMRVLLTVPVK